MRVAAHGLSIEVPGHWEARIKRRGEGPPVLHLASVALDAGDGVFGAAVTGRMRADDVFAALIEYPVGEQIRPGVGLFEAAGWRPRLRVGEFGPTHLQVTRPGQLGAQRFFTHAERPFCLYCVIVPVRKRPAGLVGQLTAVLGTLRF